jgi:hypothetical protein
MKPLATGNGEKINTIVFGYLSAHTHGVKLTIGFYLRRVPETGNSAEKEEHKQGRGYLLSSDR